MFWRNGPLGRSVALIDETAAGAERWVWRFPTSSSTPYGFVLAADGMSVFIGTESSGVWTVSVATGAAVSAPTGASFRNIPLSPDFIGSGVIASTIDSSYGAGSAGISSEGAVTWAFPNAFIGLSPPFAFFVSSSGVFISTTLPPTCAKESASSVSISVIVGSTVASVAFLATVTLLVFRRYRVSSLLVRSKAPETTSLLGAKLPSDAPSEPVFMTR